MPQSLQSHKSVDQRRGMNEFATSHQYNKVRKESPGAEVESKIVSGKEEKKNSSEEQKSTQENFFSHFAGRKEEKMFRKV